MNNYNILSEQINSKEEQEWLDRLFSMITFLNQQGLLREKLGKNYENRT